MPASTNIFDIFENDANFVTIMKHLLEVSIDASFNGVMITEASPGYPILYVNPALCEMTGYDPYDLIGKSPALLQGPDTDQWVLDQLKTNIESGQLFHGRTVNYRKDGSPFVMDWKIAPVRDAAGKISHYLAIQREVYSEATEI
jgi:PAS domain S-box-containing protein